MNDKWQLKEKDYNQIWDDLLNAEYKWEYLDHLKKSYISRNPQFFYFIRKKYKKELDAHLATQRETALVEKTDQHKAVEDLYRVIEDVSRYPSYFYFPPTTYKERAKQLHELRPAQKHELSSYWRQNNHTWPDKPEDWLEIYNTLKSESCPKKYLRSLKAENVGILLLTIEGWLKSEEWEALAGGKPNQSAGSPGLFWEAEDFSGNPGEAARLGFLLELVNTEQVVRMVDRKVWNVVNVIIDRHQHLYPQGENELSEYIRAHYAQHCNQYKKDIDRYLDRQNVVKKKVEKILEPHENSWLRARENADIEAVNDNSGRSLEDHTINGFSTSATNAVAAENKAKIAEFAFLVYRDYLACCYGHLSSSSQSVKDSFTAKNWVWFYYFTGAFEGSKTYKAKEKEIASEITNRRGCKCAESTCRKERKSVSRLSKGGFPPDSLDILRKVRQKIVSEELDPKDIDSQIKRASNGE